MFIKTGLLVRERARPKGVAIVAGSSTRDGYYRICRWRGGPMHWSLPIVVALEQLAPIDDWTTMPLTEAKRISSAAYERNYLARAMETAKGSIVDAARIARIDRSNFRRLLERHGLAKPPRPKKAPSRRRRRRSK
jgi:hypothetical protein